MISGLLILLFSSPIFVTGLEVKCMIWKMNLQGRGSHSELNCAVDQSPKIAICTFSIRVLFSKETDNNSFT